MVEAIGVFDEMLSTSDDFPFDAVLVLEVLSEMVMVEDVILGAAMTTATEVTLVATGVTLVATGVTVVATGVTLATPELDWTTDGDRVDVATR